MDGRRIAGERVEDQNFELVRSFALQDQSGVANDNIALASTVAQKIEVLTGDQINLRIDFIKTDGVFWTDITSQSANSHANHSNSNGRLRLYAGDSERRCGSFTVVRCRQ